MRALFVTPAFRFYKEIPAAPMLYEIGMVGKLSEVDHDDTRAVVPAPKMYIMQFEYQEPAMLAPWEERPKEVIYKYIGIKESVV